MAHRFTILLLALASHAPATAGAAPALSCQSAARLALGSCTSVVAQAQTACHQQTGAPCASDNPMITAALTALAVDIESACTAAAISDAELGPNKTMLTVTASVTPVTPI